MGVKGMIKRHWFVEGALGLALVAGGGCGGEKPAEEHVGQVSAAVSGAAFTTFDVNQDGCTQGNHPNGVNCNHYACKSDVYINGGPVKNGLDNGKYYFTVIAPGAQNGGFLDGAEGNLSDAMVGGGLNDV